MLVVWMGRGLSLESFAGEIDVNKTTIYEWIKNFDDFSNAFERGKLKRLAYFEKVGIEGMWTVKETDGGGGSYTKSLNAAVYKMFMFNVCGWSDKVQTTTETTHKVDGVTSDEKKETLKKLAELNGDVFRS